MTNRGWGLTFHLAGVALAMIATAPAHAQVREMTTAQVAAASRAVVVAKVLAVDVRQDVNIFTFVELQTVEVIKGDVPVTFTYRMLGGRLGTNETASGDPLPVFKPGEEVVLFLGQQVSQAGYPTVYQRAIFHVTTLPSGEKVIDPEPTGMAIIRVPGAGGPVRTTTRPVRLADFIYSLKLR